MGSRGADISWCSQYPFEKEVCFAPLLGLEVQEAADGAPAKRIEGGVVVVELLASVSHGGLEEEWATPEKATPPLPAHTTGAKIAPAKDSAKQRVGLRVAPAEKSPLRGVVPTPRF